MFGYCTVDAYNNLNCKQIVRHVQSDRELVRHMIDGVWQPWRWVVPEMALDAVYPTTEQWLGLPVYTTVIDCGLASDGKQVDITHLGASVIVRAESITDGWAPLPVITNTVYCNVVVVPGLITVRCSEMYAGTSVHCRIWYTKAAA